jgi:hypothetical protein
MGKSHHRVDVGILGQQLVLDALDGVVERAGHALHAGADAEMLRVPTEPSALR